MTSRSEVVDGRPAAAEAEEETAAALEDVLGRLMERGYQFVHPRDADGDIVTIVGVRVHADVVDVVRFDAEDDVTAMRMPETEADILEPVTVLWREHGAMRDVVDALLTLPDAAENQLRRGTTGHGCWVSGNRGQSKWLRATA